MTKKKYPDRKDKNQLQAEPSCNTGSWNHTIFPEVLHEAMSIPLTNTLMDTSRRELLKLQVYDVSRNFTQLSTSVKCEKHFVTSDSKDARTRNKLWRN